MTLRHYLTALSLVLALTGLPPGRAADAGNCDPVVCPGNGPHLTGIAPQGVATIVVGATPAHALGDGHLTDPALTGRAEESQEPRLIQCDDWDCGANGPALSGTQWEQERSPQEPRLINCDEWDCGSNGPALTGRAEEAVAPGQAAPPSGPPARAQADQADAPQVFACSVFVCGDNGPVLTGRAEEAQEPRFAPCPGCGGNGPALRGTRWEQERLPAGQGDRTAAGMARPEAAARDDAAQEPRLIDCNEWDCGGNGPALSGTRWEQERLPAAQGDHTAAGMARPEAVARDDAAQEPRFAPCPGCGVNGPALSGTRAAGHGLLPTPAGTIRVPPLAHPDAP